MTSLGQKENDYEQDRGVPVGLHQQEGMAHI